MKIKKIYLDMDGVLADFNRGVKELCGMEAYKQCVSGGNDDIMWEAIRDAGHFYDRLELMPGAVEMYNKLSSRYDVEILTGIPKPKRGILTAGEDKTAWAHRLLSEDLKVNIVFREDKIKYITGPDCILIDDLSKNIEEWTRCGGSGVQFFSAEDALQKIEQLEKA